MPRFDTGWVGGVGVLAGWKAEPAWLGWLSLGFGGLAAVQGVLKARLRWRCPVVKG